MNRSIWRKVIYLTAMALLLFPLSLLSRPDTPKTANQPGDQGGELTKMRTKHGLSQANLGEIDPTGETIKLATLGMRGVAANILWKKANDFQRTEDWTSLSATLEQISKVQPNFVSVWRFQGWNLSYNVSVEWDDYRQRYHWVLKGVDFLRQGMKYNQLEPILAWDVGWVLGHKIGTADEKKQYRILFRRDDDFHGSRAMAQRDNWLVGKRAFLEGQQIVDTKNVPVKGQSEVLFHSNPAKWQINYAIALEEDGKLIELPDRWDSRPQFAEVAKTAFNTALEEWDDFGATREVVTGSGFRIRLGELKRYEKERDDAIKAVEDIDPTLKPKLIQEKKDKLTDEERAAMDTEPAQRTPEVAFKAAEAEIKMRVELAEIVERLPDEKKKIAEGMKETADKLSHRVKSTNTTRGIIQYEEWRTRCEAERTDDAIAARERMYEGKVAFENEVNLDKAKSLYEESFRHWRKVLDAFPTLMNDRVVTDDLIGPVYLPGGIRYYERVLKKLDEKFPQDFILKDLLDRMNPDPPIGK